MSERGFETHRCQLMPVGFSLRRYAPDGKPLQYPEPGGWVLGMAVWNSEWDCEYLSNVTPMARQHVRFCPWCGEDLEVER